MAPRHTLGSKPPREHAHNRKLRPRGDSAIPREHRVPPMAPRGAPTRSRVAPMMGAIVGVAIGAGALGAITWSSGCASDTPPGPHSEPASAQSADLAALPTPVAEPDDSNEPVVEEPDQPKTAEVEPETDKPWDGPWLGALAQSTPIYPTARFSKNRMGYIRRGGKVPVVDEPVKTASCKQGFYPLVDGGYVCGKYATTKVDDARVKLGVKPPDVDALLPYTYAYNRAHGTPLYTAVPSKEEMLRYEPYLADKDTKKDDSGSDSEKHAESADQPRAPVLPPSSAHAAAVTEPAMQFLTDAGVRQPPAEESAGGAAAEPELEPDKPWWQKDDMNEVKLADLDESDGTLSKRMVKGFFIAVDRTFGWNDRMWYKATDGLIAPADRMIIPKAPDLKGIDVPAGAQQVGFITWRKGHKYDWPEGDKRPKRGSQLSRYLAVGLTGKTRLHEKERYRETVEGWWLNESHATWTDPSERPSEVSPDEKWIDVNLTRKTLLALVGDKPMYAAIISPGKRSSNKAKDHRTKTGKWRLREKHITTTMDGDGPAGDLPYSIQDVPYVQYYDGSYALHGAFWHNNFGREQSHGCVNLSPLDAKHLFFWTEPSIPRGWHGVWSSDKRQGTWVVVHE